MTLNAQHTYTVYAFLQWAPQRSKGRAAPGVFFFVEFFVGWDSGGCRSRDSRVSLSDVIALKMAWVPKYLSYLYSRHMKIKEPNIDFLQHCSLAWNLPDDWFLFATEKKHRPFEGQNCNPPTTCCQPRAPNS